MGIFKNLFGPVLEEIRIDLAEHLLYWAICIVPKKTDAGHFMTGCVKTYFIRVVDVKTYGRKGWPHD